MSDTKVNQHPAQVTVEDRAILVDAPGGAIVTFTPEAADETASRLRNAVRRARGAADEGPDKPDAASDRESNPA